MRPRTDDGWLQQLAWHSAHVHLGRARTSMRMRATMRYAGIKTVLSKVHAARPAALCRCTTDSILITAQVAMRWRTPPYYGNTNRKGYRHSIHYVHRCGTRTTVPVYASGRARYVDAHVCARDRYAIALRIDACVSKRPAGTCMHRCYPMRSGQVLLRTLYIPPARTSRSYSDAEHAPISLDERGDGTVS